MFRPAFSAFITFGKERNQAKKLSPCSACLIGLVDTQPENLSMALTASFAFVGPFLALAVLICAANAQSYIIEASWLGFGRCAGGINYANVYGSDITTGSAGAYKFVCNSTTVSYYQCTSADGSNCTLSDSTSFGSQSL